MLGFFFNDVRFITCANLQRSLQSASRADIHSHVQWRAVNQILVLLYYRTYSPAAENDEGEERGDCVSSSSQKVTPKSPWRVSALRFTPISTPLNYYFSSSFWAVYEHKINPYRSEVELVICSPPSPWNRFCGTIRYRGFNGNGSRGIMERGEDGPQTPHDTKEAG